ncbi:MAG: hypothetical protein BWX49_00028 [Bacteroidetes bacterium ADurb.Bin008]|nr:MAG: hypothetical protein BWX49_00028 [Bacteroidetes bacterium ADurb.Bin008]
MVTKTKIMLSSQLNSCFSNNFPIRKFRDGIGIRTKVSRRIVYCLRTDNST